MFVDEMEIGAVVDIEAWSGSMKAKLSTEVVDMDPRVRAILGQHTRVLPVKLIEENGKVVSFPQGIIYKVYINYDGTPYMWNDVAIQIVNIPGSTERYHLIMSQQDAKPFNRREFFRLFLGCSGVAQINNNHSATDVLVKDVSAQGVGFITDIDNRNSISVGDNVHITFEDRDSKTKFNIIAEVVRIVAEDETRELVGCRMAKYSDPINRYVMTKQRERVRVNKTGA